MFTKFIAQLTGYVPKELWRQHKKLWIGCLLALVIISFLIPAEMLTANIYQRIETEAQKVISKQPVKTTDTKKAESMAVNKPSTTKTVAKKESTSKPMTNKPSTGKTPVKTKIKHTSKTTLSKENIKPITLTNQETIVGTTVKPGRYHITTTSDELEVTVNNHKKGHYMANVFGHESNREDGTISTYTIDLLKNASITLKDPGTITLTPVTNYQTLTTLKAGHWLVGRDIKPGKYTLDYLHGIGDISTTKSHTDIMMGSESKNLTESTSVNLIDGEILKSDVENIQLTSA